MVDVCESETRVSEVLRIFIFVCLNLQMALPGICKPMVDGQCQSSERGKLQIQRFLYCS